MDSNLNNKQIPSVISIVKPIIITNQFIGVCPHDIQQDILVFNKTSIHFFKTLFSLSILTLYFIYLLVQFESAIKTNQNFVQLIIISAWALNIFMAIAIMIVTLVKRHEYTDYYQKCGAIHEKLHDIIPVNGVMRKALTYYGFYIFQTFFMCIIIGYFVCKNPMQKIYFVHYFWTEDSYNSFYYSCLVLLNCIFQSYIIILTNCAFALVEVHCGTISRAMVDLILKVQLDLKSSLNRIYNHKRKDSSVTNQNILSKRKRVGQVFPEEQIKLNHDENCNGKRSHSYLIDEEESGNEFCCTKSDVTTRAIKITQLAIQRFHFCAQKIRLINDLFGLTLVLNVAFMVTHLCILLFLQIRYSWKGMEESYETFPTVISSPSSPITNDSMQDNYMAMTTNTLQLAPTTCTWNGQMFAHIIHLLIYTTRLLVLLVSLGNVSTVAKCFDDEIVESVMRIGFEQNPTAFTHQLRYNHSYEMDLILVHLIGKQSTTVCFSAGGFFVFNRSTILYVFSFITTYVVFLLQQA